MVVNSGGGDKSSVYESDECGCVGLSGKRGTQAKKFSLNVENPDRVLQIKVAY